MGSRGRDSSGSIARWPLVAGSSHGLGNIAGDNRIDLLGFAVADGRPIVIAAEVVVASSFIILAAVAIGSSPWLVVIGLAGHGIKDLWQHRTHFVANTRWWPPFCLVVDLVAAIVIAVLVLTGFDFNG